MDIAKSETFKNFIVLNKALLFLIKLSKTAVQSVPKSLLVLIKKEDFKSNLKGHSTRILKNCEKIFKNMVTNMTPLRFLQLIRLRKSKKKIFFPLRIQISAILFQIDCAINQFVTSISESC